jgi:hypothetical protein
MKEKRMEDKKEHKIKGTEKYKRENGEKENKGPSVNMYLVGDRE